MRARRRGSGNGGEAVISVAYNIISTGSCAFVRGRKVDTASEPGGPV